RLKVWCSVYVSTLMSRGGPRKATRPAALFGFGPQDAPECSRMPHFLEMAPLSMAVLGDFTLHSRFAPLGPVPRGAVRRTRGAPGPSGSEKIRFLPCGPAGDMSECKVRHPRETATTEVRPVLSC